MRLPPRPSLPLTLCFALLLGGIAAAQQPPPAPAPKAEEPPPPLPVLDDKEAAERIADFKRAYTKSADLGRRLEGVKKIATHRNERFAIELQKITLADPNPIVRAEAAKALGRQDGPKAKVGIVACLKGLQAAEQQVVLLALLDALQHGAYDPAYFDVLAPLFDKESTQPAVQQRIVRLFGKGQEKRAFRLLVDNLNEPIPENVDDPSNPPASYWEMRWKKWDVWRLDVAKALKDLTGVEFKEKKFYKEWAKGEGKKLGFKY